MEELVSVIIPTYNRKNTLKRAIDSVLNQTYKNIELIIVDDCSTDGTYEYVSELYGDLENLIYVQNDENQGASGARNSGVLYANGDFIAFHDSDDEWLPTKLEKQMAIFEQKGSLVGMVYCQMKHFPKNEEIYFWPPSDMEESKKTDNIFETLLMTPLVGTPSMVIRKALFVALGGFDTNLKSLEDYEFSLRFSKEYNVGYVDEPLINVYESAGSVGKQREAMTLTQVVIMQRYYQDFIKYDLRKDKMIFVWLQSETNGCIESLEGALEKFAADEVYLSTFLMLEENRKEKRRNEAKRKIGILFDDRNDIFVDGIAPSKDRLNVSKTALEFLEVIWLLDKKSPDTFVSIYHYEAGNIFPWSVNSVIIKDEKDFFEKRKNEPDDITLIVLKPESDLWSLFSKTHEKGLCWLLGDIETYSDSYIKKLIDEKTVAGLICNGDANNEEFGMCRKWLMNKEEADVNEWENVIDSARTSSHMDSEEEADILVSVVMPAYNAGKFIEQSICSVLNQTYKQIELVIVNDGSTDNTVSIIEKYESLFPNKIVFVNKEQNEGTARTLNIAMEYASGDYMCWLSADDLYSETMVESQLRYLLNHPERDACFSLSSTIDENNNFIRVESRSEDYLSQLSRGNMQPFYQRLLMQGNSFHGCSLLGKRENFLAVGGFNPQFRYSHDYDFWLRFAASSDIGFVREYNVMGRTYPTQISRQGHNELDAIRVFTEFVKNKELFERIVLKAGLPQGAETIHEAFQNRIMIYRDYKDELLTVLDEYRKYVENC